MEESQEVREDEMRKVIVWGSEGGIGKAVLNKCSWSGRAPQQPVCGIRCLSISPSMPISRSRSRTESGRPISRVKAARWI